MTIKVRLLYFCRNGEIGFRDASEHVPDVRDLDSNGKPPAWFLPHESIVAEADEVEFDHKPSADELQAEFKEKIR